jgi:hypothetical protein
MELDRLDNFPVIKLATFRRKKKRVNHLEKSYGSLVTSELLPFSKVMRYQLLKRGYNTRHMKFNDLVPLYYNEFVSNQNNKSSSYQPVNCYDFRNNASFKIHPSDNFNGDIQSFRNRLHFAEVNKVIDGIVQTFKVSKKKKDYALQSGFSTKNLLTVDERIQANALEQVTQKLTTNNMMNTPVTKKQLKNIIILALVIYFLYVLFK